MNKPVDQSQFQTPEVTTGALPASTKVYTHPKADPTLRVPHRSIALHPAAALRNMKAAKSNQKIMAARRAVSSPANSRPRTRRYGVSTAK